MTTLYIIRHAEAEGNVYRRCHGQHDGKVTPNGRKQIDALRERFYGTVFDAVYSSDLTRAAETAQALDTDRRESFAELREFSLGEWEDKPWQQIAREAPETYSQFLSGWDFTVPGGETAAQAQNRSCAKVRELCGAHRNGTLAVVTHGMVGRMLVSGLTGKPMGHPEFTLVDNTGVTVLETDDIVGGFTVKLYGDNSHLTNNNLSTISKQSWWKKASEATVAQHEDYELWYRPVEQSDMKLAVKLWSDAYEQVFRFPTPSSECEREITALQGYGKRYAQFIMKHDEPIGVLGLDCMKAVSNNSLHTTLLYLTPQNQGQGLGVQAIGEMVSVCREIKRAKVSLYVKQKNTRALRFYLKHGFRRTGIFTGAYNHWVLELAVSSF